MSFIFLAISERNSGRSIVPLPSASTSPIMSCSSASVGFWPSDLITVPSSFVVIVPSPSLSKREKASLNRVSATCSSVSWSGVQVFSMSSQFVLSMPCWYMLPLSQSSTSSSSVSMSFIFLAISERNSGKSIVPLPSASTSSIMSCSSASVGFWPSDSFPDRRFQAGDADDSFLIVDSMRTTVS